MYVKFGINTTRGISKLSQITYNNLEISLQTMLLPILITPDESSLFLTFTGNSRGLQLSLVFGGLFSSRPPNTRQQRPLLAGGRLETRKIICDAKLSRNEDHFLVSFSPFFFSFSSAYLRPRLVYRLIRKKSE